MLKGAGLWRIVSGNELASSYNSRPNSNPVATSSRASRRSVAAQQQPLQQPPQQPPEQPPQQQANDAHEGSYLQYQTHCDLAASYVYSSLGVEAIKHFGNISEPREMWDILEKPALLILSRSHNQLTQIDTSFVNEKMKDNDTVSSYIARLIGF